MHIFCKTLIALACFSTLLSGCDCSCDCPAFDSALLAYMPYNVGDSIRFTNGSGTNISFGVVAKITSEGYHDEGKKETLGCGKVICKADGHMTARSLTSRNGSDSLNLSFYEGYLDEAGYNSYVTPKYPSLTVLDFTMQTTSNKDLVSGQSTTTYASFTLGSHNYSNVVVYTLDTMSVSPSVWRVYLSKDGGVLGFDDRRTQSLFYLR